jgi:transcriptional regulator GlxA family with amidase domain
MKNSTTICFILLPKVHLLDMAGPAQVFYEASQLGTTRYIIQFAGLEKETVAEQGLLLGSLTLLKDTQLTKGDFVMVPGIDFKSFQEGQLSKSIRLLAPWLKEQWQRGANIASICSGSLVLAEVGLLDGRRCTSHWKCIDYMKKNYPDAQVETDQLFVNDERIFTSAGMTSGIDMALSIVEEAHGPVLPAKVAREMVVYLRRNHDDHQQTIYLDYQTHFNPAIHRVQDYIISNPTRNPSLQELAKVGNVSVRNLTRMFKKTTGHTIIEFKNSVRVELARTLLHNGDFTLEKIAGLCGFQNARQLRRLWKVSMGTTLSEFKNSRVPA